MKSNINKNQKVANPTKILQRKEKDRPNYKLPEDMENEIKDAFAYYDTTNCQKITRTQLRSILGNFAFTNENVKEIEDEIKIDYPVLDKDKERERDKAKDNKDLKKEVPEFSLDQVIQLISRKWFYGGGREAEANEIFKLFDKKNKNVVGLAEIKQLFGQYLDINISDADITEFIQEADLDKDGCLNKTEFCSKLGYI